MSTFLGFTCCLCGTHFPEYPGLGQPPVWLLVERQWACHACIERRRKPQANTATGPVQVYMDLYFEGEAA